MAPKRIGLVLLGILALAALGYLAVFHYAPAALGELTLGPAYARLPAPLQAHFRALSVFPADFAAPAAAFVWRLEAKQREADRDLAELVDRGLLDRRAGRYRLNDRIRTFATARQTKDERVCTAVFHATYYLKMLFQAKRLYRQGGDHIREGLALFDQERANILAGQAFAAAHAETSLNGARAAGGFAVAGLDILAQRLSPRERIVWLKPGIRGAKKLKDRRLEDLLLGELAGAYGDSGDTRRAIELYDQRLAFARETGNRSAERVALAYLGLAYYDLGEDRRAIEFYQRGLALAREAGDRLEEADALGNMGISYKHLGDFRRAIELEQQDLAIRREVGDPAGEELALASLGNAYTGLKDTQHAIDFYEQELVLAKKIPDRSGEATALHNLGLSYLGLGDIRRAAGLFEQDLAIAHELGDRRVEYETLGSLGKGYFKLGEPLRASEYLEQQIAKAREIGDRNREAGASWNLGLAYEQLGGLRRAIDKMQILVDFERQTGRPGAEKHAAYVEALRVRLQRESRAAAGG
ncbi:MAG TPA: tetratricopeptide repeat protein [Thermoanaerobaculia bacterium]|jgi:tetratricopeptide (TPR) repeat protein|nr:tetratricopeptide repeat protein [Thermoanaerobaculia bacterium]